MSDGRRKSPGQNQEFSSWQSVGDLMTALLLIFVLFLTVVALKNLQEKERLKTEIDSFFNRKEEIVEELRNVQAKLAKQGILICLNEKSGVVSIPTPGLFNDGDYFLNERKSRKPAGEENIKCPSGWRSPTNDLVTNNSLSNVKMMDTFLKEYFTVVWNKNYSDYISEIQIIGYTNTSQLSTRTISWNNCMNSDAKYEYTYGTYDQTPNGPKHIYIRPGNSVARRLFSEKLLKKIDIDKNGRRVNFRRLNLGNVCLSQKRAQMIYNFAWNRIISSYENNGWRLGPKDRNRWKELLENSVTTSGRGPANLIRDPNTGEEMSNFSKRVEFQFRVNDRDQVKKILEENS